METLFIYLAKSSCLIEVFYLSYFFLLRKETFFNSNRWFLLSGLITSAILPLVFITKIVWVEPTPTTFDWSKIPVTTNGIENEGFEINWYLVSAIVYGVGILGFLAKFAFDFYSLSKVLKGKTIQRQADFKFIDVSENVSPFSYFNSIVYNSSLYSETELENILEHEKVHSTQNHTVDVLISRMFCIVFWFNPLMWLYKKAIVQNLEFIADSEASKNIADKKTYQLTLLKITTQENCVAITNHFYQSLIKKRIVMLNKNQSNKRNSWKYALILPVLVTFVLLYQVEVIAKEFTKKESEIIAIPNQTTINFSRKESNDEINKKCETLKKTHDLTLKISEIKRNTKNEIVSFFSSFIIPKGKGSATYELQPEWTEFSLIITDQSVQLDGRASKKDLATLSKGKEILINENKSSEEELIKSDPKEIEAPLKLTIDGRDSEIFKGKIEFRNQLLVVNGIETHRDPRDLYTNLITSINELDKEHSIAKYGTKGKNGVFEITTKDNVFPFSDQAHSFLKTSSEPAIEKKEDKPIVITGYGTSEASSNSKQAVNGLKVKGVSTGNMGLNTDKAMIIIDGKKASKQVKIEDFNPNDIESISVLKGENAVRVYGKEAKNGVILIVTKEFSKK